MVPCPWIVEPWTHQPHLPGRRQPAPDASAGRGRGGDLTPPTTSHPARPAATPTENTTHRSVPADRATQPGQEPERGGRVCTRSMAGNPVQRLKQQAAGQYGHAESASPGAGASGPPEARRFGPEWAATRTPRARLLRGVSCLDGTSADALRRACRGRATGRARRRNPPWVLAYPPNGR